MKCSECPALAYGEGIDNEYWSGCGLGYEQIPYKNNDEMTYCRKHWTTILKERNKLIQERKKLV